MLVSSRHKSVAMPFLGLVWALASCGVAIAVIEALQSSSYLRTRLALYLAMGGMLMLVSGEIGEGFSPLVYELLIWGGVTYTSGLGFFLLGHTRPIYHTIWHLFVIVGSALHFVAVWTALFPGGEEGLQDDLGQAKSSMLVEQCLTHTIGPAAETADACPG